MTTPNDGDWKPTLKERFMARWARRKQRRAIKAYVRTYNTLHPAERLAIMVRLLREVPAARQEFRRALNMNDAPQHHGIELVGAMPPKLRKS